FPDNSSPAIRLTLSPNLASVLSKVERSSYTLLSRCWFKLILTDEPFLSDDATAQRTIQFMSTIN
ncbi:MAG: hypothetical protein NWQ62_06015, partial [Cyanobium sp. MAG_102]|nr:hypothetical protein [Cyanobium sp. MAG_102]